MLLLFNFLFFNYLQKIIFVGFNRRYKKIFFEGSVLRLLNIYTYFLIFFTWKIKFICQETTFIYIFIQCIFQFLTTGVVFRPFCNWTAQFHRKIFHKIPGLN